MNSRLDVQCMIPWAICVSPFYTPVSRRSVLCDWVWRVGGRPHRFPCNNFSSVYWIFTQRGHMILLWKGDNPIYFGVKGQGHCYFKYNFWQQGCFRMITLVLSLYWIFTKLDHMIALWKGKNPIYFEIIRSKVKVTVTINIIFDNRVVSAR